jgi:hypothetical protein
VSMTTFKIVFESNDDEENKEGDGVEKEQQDDEIMKMENGREGGRKGKWKM